MTNKSIWEWCGDRCLQRVPATKWRIVAPNYLFWLAVCTRWYTVDMGCCSSRMSWRLILHQVWKANWDPERGSMWNLQCWRLWGLSEWIWIPPQVWIGVATTVGTYKAAAPDPSDLELISSAASKENPPGWFVYGNSGRKTLRFGALHFTMNGLHLNL